MILRHDGLADIIGYERDRLFFALTINTSKFDDRCDGKIASMPALALSWMPKPMAKPDDLPAIFVLFHLRDQPRPPEQFW